jgi:hypothetical protein
VFLVVAFAVPASYDVDAIVITIEQGIYVTHVSPAAYGPLTFLHARHVGEALH